MTLFQCLQDLKCLMCSMETVKPNMVNVNVNHSLGYGLSLSLTFAIFELVVSEILIYYVKECIETVLIITVF